MSATVVGPHDPIFLNAPHLGNWIECECGWISGGYALPSRAVEAHQLHVEKRAQVAVRGGLNSSQSAASPSGRDG